MKKETFGKLATFPETTPDAQRKPKEETQRANNHPNISQDDTYKKSGFSGELTIRIPKSLHAKLDEQASKEGVPLAHYIIYKLAR